MTGIWKTWMQIWMLGALAFGVLLVCAAFPGLDAPAKWVVALLASDPSNAAALEHSATRFGLGVQGALTIGWVLTMRILLILEGRTASQAWGMHTLAVIVWVMVDSVISVATGFAFNAISNALLFASFIAPVLGSGVLRKA